MSCRSNPAIAALQRACLFLFLSVSLSGSLAVGLAAADPLQSGHPGVPDSGFFIGLGAGFGSADFGTQSVYNKGISDVFENGVLVASGVADGPPVDIGLGTESGFIPALQLGYFQHFDATDWLWGAKFAYNHPGMTATTRNLIIPQYGTSTDPNLSSFTGYSVTKSYSVSIDHQATSLFFAGRSFARGFVYLGAGPSLSQITTRLDGVVGYATINGVLTDISGAPQSFSSTDWRVGAAATAGVTYFLTPSVFIDANYVFNAPDARKLFITSPFDNPSTPLAFSGTLIGKATSNVRNTQIFTISINKAF